MDSVFTSPPPRVDFRLQHPPATTRLFCNTLHPPASHSTTRIAGISTTARERRSVIMSAPARGPEATPLLSVVETSERARGSQLASAASKKKFLAAVGAVALVGLAAAVSLDGGERFAATGSRLGASRAQRRKNARARRIRDGAVAAAGLAPKPDPSAPKVPVKFRVFTSCIDDRVRALAPAGFFDAAIADVRVVHHNYRTYGPENFFVWERGYETTPFDEASAYGSGFEVTTDLVDWEFGFALKNANGVEWYEIGVGEQGVKKGLAAVKAPLAGLNINGDDHAPGCAQVYGDYFNRAFTREEKEGGVISYVFGSCAETCVPPPPPPPPPSPAAAPSPSTAAAVAATTSATIHRRLGTMHERGHPCLEQSDDGGHRAVLPRRRQTTFGTSTTKVSTKSAYIKSSRRFQRCTSRTQCRPIPSKCGLKIIGVQRRCRTRLARFKSTPKIRRAIKTSSGPARPSALRVSIF